MIGKFKVEGGGLVFSFFFVRLKEIKIRSGSVSILSFFITMKSEFLSSYISKVVIFPSISRKCSWLSLFKKRF